MKFILLFCLLLTNVALASEGVGTKGGGDTDPMQIATILDFLANNAQKLKDREIQYIRGLDISSMSTDSLEQKTFKDMLNQGDLEADIRESIYTAGGPCLDGIDQNHSASTMIGEKKASICVDFNKLFSDKTNTLTLIALALHEHAHHYGKSEDAASAFSDFVASDLNNKFIQMGLDHAHASCSLVTDLKVGTTFEMLHNLEMNLQPVFQRGMILDGMGNVESGVYCYSYGPTLKAGKYKIVSPVTSHEEHDEFSSNSYGNLLPKRFSTSSMVDIPLNRGIMITCLRKPDNSQKISVCDLRDAVFGSIEIK